MVLQTLREHQLYAKFCKCELWLKSISFFGHVVSENEIEVDPKKVKVVVDWLKPTKVTEIKSFVGLASYHKRFIPNFSKIITPMTRLTQKNKKFKWSDLCEESLQKLKECLISAPVLALPMGNEDFKVYYNAFRVGLGCVLM
ncbi:uncharacterized mitochondrial protein AtMg00860-like [Hevea brasiliensis]|uniref:uncharacterized mitochondrial protein AtMg00860-like n=1 Tax=Hevea brasiliensis TaxID=3981 RepID=UPI0025E45256|nr:uncharacterized mitochondrial protein AtMg00860-like [Hevea brasiliensis]